MYTEEMAKAFHDIEAPASGFKIALADCEDFLEIRIDPNDLVSLSKEDQVTAVEYINKVKLTLEALGSIVLISREAIE